MSENESGARSVDELNVPDGYELREGTPSIASFRRIRGRAGMTDRPANALADGLSNTTYGVHVERAREDGRCDGPDHRRSDGDTESVAMGRIVGDGATAFLIVDVAVAERHQGRGLGTAVMDTLMNWLREHAPAGGYVYLFADVDGFYQRWGFEPSAPASTGLWIRTSELS